MGGRGSQTRVKSGSAVAFDPTPFLGKRAVKDFEVPVDENTKVWRAFGGTVRSYYAKGGWFLVEYDDGDKEDVSLDEVRAMIRRAEAGDDPAAAPATEGDDDEEGAEEEAEEEAESDLELEETSEEEEEGSEAEEAVPRRGTRARGTPAAPALVAVRTRSSPAARAQPAAPAAKRRGRASPRPRSAPAKRARRRYVDDSSNEEEYTSDDSEELEGEELMEDSESEPESESEEEVSEEESEEEEEEEEEAPPTRSPAAENRAANTGAGGAGPSAPRASPKPKPKAKPAPPKPKAKPATKKRTSLAGPAYKCPKPKRKGPLPPADALPPQPQPKVRVTYAPGEEPFLRLASYLATPISLVMDLSAAAVNIIHDAKQQYYKLFRRNTIEEDLRVAREMQERREKQAQKKAAATRAAAPATQEAAPAEEEEEEDKESSLSKRPDRRSESDMKRGGLAVHQGKRIGHVPGIRVSDRFYGRSEMSVLGLHLPPVAGIDFLGAGSTGLGIPFAVSVVCAGWYEDDADNGAELVYTGEGGNDLLGSRKQWAPQELTRGNAALLGNIRLGIPVRLTRKNRDSSSIYGCVLIYDGLYDVVEWWQEAGKSGHAVFKFRMIRRPDQGPLISQAVKYGGCSAPRALSALSRVGVVDADVSGKKEALPIHAVNDTGDEELPPCTDLARVPAIRDLKGVTRGISDAKLAELRAAGHRPTVEYVTQYRYAPGVNPPALPVVPSRFVGVPHDYVAHLNRDRLPYIAAKGGKVHLLAAALPVVYECGPWAGCPLGADCPQAVTQRGIRYRLELFKTDDGRGWGVRSLDMIPQFAFICDYYGDVYSAAAYEAMVAAGHDGEYSMDMAVRPDRDWEGNVFEGRRRTADAARFVVCGLKRRNVAAFINHSCTPNCFVQPVLAAHHDDAMPKISIFAAEDIAPFTQLTWDYGEDYASTMEGGCRCGAADCISKRQAGGGGPAGSPLRSPAKRPGAGLGVAPAVAAVLRRAGARAEADAEMEGAEEGEGSEPDSSEGISTDGE